MSELTFLIDLLLNHELAKPTKEAVATRIKEVEQQITASPQTRYGAIPPVVTPLPPNLAKQAPSTIAAMIRHGDIPPVEIPQQPAPLEMPAVIAQNPITEQALLHRQAMLTKPKNKPLSTR